MFLYVLKRLFQSLITLFVITTVVFLLLRLMPEEGYFGENYDEAYCPRQIERQSICVEGDAGSVLALLG